MYCPSCGTHNEPTNRFCIRCGASLETTAPAANAAPGVALTTLPAAAIAPAATPGAPIMVTPAVMPVAERPAPKPAGPLAIAAPLGGIAGIVGGLAAVIGWFMPWFGLGQIGASLGNMLGGAAGLFGLGGGLGALAGGIGGSGFQLLLLVIQVPALVNSFGGYYNSNTGLIFIAIILAILLLILIPIMGIMCIRAGIWTVQLHSERNSSGVNLFKKAINSLASFATFGFILMVIIFILLAQIPFATMLLSSGFFITAGGFVLAWVCVLLAKGQVRPVA